MPLLVQRRRFNSLFRNALASGDGFEVSTLRREDFNIVNPTETTHDVLQVNSTPSNRTRGHQYPWRLCYSIRSYKER